MKRIAIVAVIALLCALMVLGTMSSVIAAAVTFAVVLCIGLYPGDFGFGRKEKEIYDPVVDKYFDDDEPTAEERAAFIDVPEYKEDDWR